jgi:integrase
MSPNKHTRGQKGGKMGNPKVAGPQRFRFTKDTVAALAPGPQPYFAWDTKERGLCVLVAVSGTKTFFYRYKVAGRSKRFKLGRFPGLAVGAAQSRTIVRRGAVESGSDPAQEKRERRAEMTVGELITLYTDEHLRLARKPKAAAAAEQLTRDYLADLVGLRLSDLTHKGVVAWHVAASAKSRSRANRALEVLSAACSHALYRELDPERWASVNPCHGVKANPEIERERFLSPDELGRFLRALDAEPADLRDLFLLALYTGARRSNVLALKWDDVDMAGGVWQIEAAESKSGKAMSIPLVGDAIALLRRRKAELDALIRRAGTMRDATGTTLREAQHRAVERRKAEHAAVYVFPGLGTTGHLVEPKKAWARVCRRAKIKQLRIHDLRRTVGSLLGQAGTSAFVIQAALGHRSLSATARYTKLNLTAVRAALEGVAASFAKAAKQAEQEAAKVVPIKAKRGAR